MQHNTDTKLPLEVPSNSRDADDSLMPRPIAFGALGLLLAWALPGGITGGAGFLIGAVLGLIITRLVIPIASERSARYDIGVATCPYCENSVYVAMTHCRPLLARGEVDLDEVSNV
jgi:hypothetical protein